MRTVDVATGLSKRPKTLLSQEGQLNILLMPDYM